MTDYIWAVPDGGEAPPGSFMPVTEEIECDVLESLAREVPKWIGSVPLYQRRDAPNWGRLANPGTVLEELRRLPLITKRDIRRDFPANFIGSDTDLNRLLEDDAAELEHTSGTSEERTPLLLPFGWWNMQEDRALRLNPIVAAILDQHPQARRVTISSPVCGGEVCYSGSLSRDNRIVGHTLFASLSRLPFLWSDTDLDRVAMETVEWKPVFLDVDPVYGVVFARYCERRGIRLPSLKFIVCSYEFVSILHRRILERAFGVPVFNLYGSTETGHLLMECPTEESEVAGTMRACCQTAFLDLIHPDTHGVGEVVATTLTNPLMPLIQYWIGDLAEHQEGVEGSRWIVHGRVADVFAGAQGKRVTTLQLDRCFIGLAGFLHYQLTEVVRGEFRLRYVADAVPPSSVTLETLVLSLSELLGSVPLVEPVDILMPETSGKFRLGYPLPRSADPAPRAAVLDEVRAATATH